jgi:beta-glucosidase
MAAGNELLMPGTGRQRRELLAALESGALKEEVLDRNVERILGTVLRTPTFHHYVHTDRPDLKAHAEVARHAAAEGMVLLRNQGVLPLKPPRRLPSSATAPTPRSPGVRAAATSTRPTSCPWPRA